MIYMLLLITTSKRLETCINVRKYRVTNENIPRHSQTAGSQRTSGYLLPLVPVPDRYYLLYTKRRNILRTAGIQQMDIHHREPDQFDPAARV